MLNAKETLKKIADALNVATDEVKTEEVVAETTEVETTEEVKEVTNEVTEETKEEVTTESVEEVTNEVTEEVKEDVKDEVKEEVAENFTPDNERLRDLEAQIEALKDILANSFVKEDTKEVETPKVPTEEPKGLTHSPEKEVKPRAKGIGQKGDNIKSRVWKYINNN